jgi:hypothetical protein
MALKNMGAGCQETCDCKDDCDLVAAFDYEITSADPLTVAFTDASTSSCTINAWFWDFGDGATSNAQNPTHEYAEPGVYLARLQAVDDCGCHATKLRVIVDCDPPDPVTAEDCGDFVETLECMWAVVQMELSGDSEVNCGCYKWGGAYFFAPSETIPWVWTLSNPAHPTVDTEEFGARNTCGSQPVSHDYPHGEVSRGSFSFSLAPDCHGDDVIFQISRSYKIVLNTTPLILGDETAFRAVSAPIDITATPIASGLTFPLTDVTGPGQGGGNVCTIESASVTFVGRPCGTSVECGTGPTAAFSLVPLGHCRYAVVNESTAGDCPIAECYWSDGFVGCDRSEAIFDANNEAGDCGDHTARLSVLVVDEKGCIDTHEEADTCCVCDETACGMADGVVVSYTFTGETDMGDYLLDCFDFTIQWKAWDACGLRVHLFASSNASDADSEEYFHGAGTIVNPWAPEEEQFAEATFNLCVTFWDWADTGLYGYKQGCVSLRLYSSPPEAGPPPYPATIREMNEWLLFTPGICSLSSCAAFGDGTYDTSCCPGEEGEWV